MGTKVKGFFKGLKNISNIFDEGEEEPEIQIGMPTDVKHVAHIGADGPATESPSWMRGFDGRQNHPQPTDTTPEWKKGTTNHRTTRSEELTRDFSNVPKTHRHHHHRSMDNSLDPDSQSSTKPNHARRHHRLRRPKEKGDLPDIPKKSRRKKTKDDDGSTKSTQSKDSESSSHGHNLDL